MDTAEAVLKVLGRGLARLLSYAFGGVLALVIAATLNSAGTAQLLRDLPWELAALAILVVGAGIYRAHRSAIIPIHHWMLCGLFWLWDWRFKRKTPAEKSLSPTRWLNSLGVGRCRRMLAYNILRHDPTFLEKEERERLDLLHAEFGLVVMMAEGCFVATAYTLRHPDSRPAWWVWLSLGVLLWFLSYPAPLQQHASECLRWRHREETEKKNGVGAVSAVLTRYKLL